MFDPVSPISTSLSKEPSMFSTLRARPTRRQPRIASIQAAPRAREM
jgi:hypothetical protein